MRAALCLSVAFFSACATTSAAPKPDPNAKLEVEREPNAGFDKSGVKTVIARSLTQG